MNETGWDNKCEGTACLNPCLGILLSEFLLGWFLHENTAETKQVVSFARLPSLEVQAWANMGQGAMANVAI